MKRLPVLALCLLILSGCDGLWGERAERQPPKELVELKDNAFRCWQDSQFVSVENSEHCVLVAEEYLRTLRKFCRDDETKGCGEYDFILSEVSALYDRAIIDALVNFGVASWMEEASGGRSFVHFIFYDGVLMRARFNACVEEETRGLKARGLRPATYIAQHRLADGQRCYRRGYPEFKTVPVSSS